MKLFTWIIGLTIVSTLFSCSSQKVSFQPVYETKLENAPDRWVNMQPDGKGFFGIEEQSIGFGGPPTLFYVDGETGKEKWIKKVTDIEHLHKKADYLHIFWEVNTVLLLSRNFGNFKMTALDVMTGNEKWHVEADENASGYKSQFHYHPEVKGILHPTPQGLRMYDASSGDVLWTREDLSSLSTEDFYQEQILGTDQSWEYLPEYDRYVVFSPENHIYFIDPATGESDWEMKENIGSLINAEIFEDEDAMIFYGTEDESLVENILESSDGLVGSILRKEDQGLVEEDIYYLDLKTGEVRWENQFFTNGVQTIAFTPDRVVVYGFALNVFDRNTGEVIWQNISEERMRQENIFKVISAMSTTDLTVGNKMKPQDLVVDGKVYALYPELIENPLKKNTVALVRYDLETGEEDWQTEYYKFAPAYYFGDEGKLFMLGTTGGFVSQPAFKVFNAANGKLILEDKLSTSYLGNAFAVKNKFYLHTFPADLAVYDLATGQEESPDLPGNPQVFRELNDEFFAVYPKGLKGGAILAIHDKQTLKVKKQMEVPGYYDDHAYQGNTYFLKDLGSDTNPGVVALDMEKFRLKGYLINKKQGTLSNESGEDLVYADYHLFISNDGKWVFELDDKQLTKYRVE